MRNNKQTDQMVTTMLA
uniref:Uncharacterized protein n=1 Tax=Rhizophora mucronata TaxID=61149 RepID=A0A2P2NMW8_RHIMU